MNAAARAADTFSALRPIAAVVAPATVERYASSARGLSLVTESVWDLLRRDRERVLRLHRRVLVVDDVDASRQAVEAHLAESLGPFGIAVDSAGTTADALGMHRARGYAAVVTDYHLGAGESGLDLLQRVGRGPRGVVVTGRVDTRRIEELARYLDARVFETPSSAGQWLALAAHVHGLVEGVIPGRG